MLLTQTYYDLINENSLPLNAYFIDPYDLSSFKPTPGENLSQFITRFEESRSEKGQPAIAQNDLKRLVIDSLYESTPKQQRPHYFQEHSAPPNLRQIYSFTRATAQTLIHRKIIAPAIRESRAKHCLNDCKFHSRSKSWAKPITDTIKKLVGIQEATVTASETALGTCMACGGCALQPKVGYSLISVLAALNPGHIDTALRVYGNKIFEQCWMFEEALKDKAATQLLTGKISHIDGNTARAISAIQFIQAKTKS